MYILFNHCKNDVANCTAHFNSHYTCVCVHGYAAFGRADACSCEMVVRMGLCSHHGVCVSVRLIRIMQIHIINQIN